MKFDDQLMISLSIELSNAFSKISNSISSIEEQYNKAISKQNWNSDTRDYYNNEVKGLKKDFDCVRNKFSNVNQYLENVINNYKAFEGK